MECTPKIGQIDNEVQLPEWEGKVHYDTKEIYQGIQARCASGA